LVILEKRIHSTILSLADALSFQIAAFFYTIATQTEKTRLNNMTTNLPAKTAMAMVVPAAAMVKMVVVGSRRRMWIGRRSQSLRCNDATNPQQNRRRRLFDVPTAATTDHLAAMLDNSGTSKMTNTTKVGPWQQSKGTRGYDNGDNDGPPSPPTDGEDNDAAAGDNRGDVTAAGNGSGDADAGTSSVVLAASNAPNPDDDAANDDANDNDAAGKKTLVSAIAGNLVSLVATALSAAFVYGRRRHHGGKDDNRGKGDDLA
jgi:hypothetical protein